MSKKKNNFPMFFLNRTTLFVIVPIICFFSYFVLVKPQQSMAVKDKATDSVVQNANVITIKTQEVQITKEIPGRVFAYKMSEIRPQVSGIIVKQLFTEGGFVKKGQQLYQVDPAIYQSDYSSSLVNLESARAKRERYQTLLAENAVSKQEYDEVSAVYAAAEAQYQKSKANLNYSKILAPISGYIGKSNLTEGSLVTAGQTEVLATISQLDPIYVDIMQPSKEVIKIDAQQEIKVGLVFEDSEEMFGVLKFSEVFSDSSTDSMRLRALFSNQNKRLLPGMFVTAKLYLKPVNKITIPQRISTRNVDGTLTVWVVEKDNLAKQRVIKASGAFKDQWIISEGLNDGEMVVFDGFQKMFDGMKVNPILIDQDGKSETEKYDSTINNKAEDKKEKEKNN